MVRLQGLGLGIKSSTYPDFKFKSPVKAEEEEPSHVLRNSAFDTDISKINERSLLNRGALSNRNFLTQGNFDIYAIPKTLKEIKKMEEGIKVGPKPRYSKRAKQMYLEIKNLARR